MKFCIFLGIVELKYFLYCFLSVILYIYIYYFIVDSEEENIINKHELLYSSCYFLGYFLNIIPAWIAQIKSKKKEKPSTNKMKERETQSIEYIYNNPYDKYFSIKDILKFFFICLILLLIDAIESTISVIENKKENKNENKKKYDDDFIIIEYLIIFLFSKYDKEVYYKHQNISFLILILVEAFKTIYFFIKANSYGISDIIIIILVLLNSILYSIFYLYIKGLMKYNFISPYKCNYMVGIINAPLIIIIYIIISFTPLGEEDNYYYFDNIFELFKKGKSDTKNIIFLISLPFAYGILLSILNKIIYEYTIYHIYIPILIEYFIQNIIKNLEIVENIILISSFVAELIMILVFVEIIEIKCCGLDENLKRNIELRGYSEWSLNIVPDIVPDDDDYDNDDFDDRNSLNDTNK